MKKVIGLFGIPAFDAGSALLLVNLIGEESSIHVNLWHYILALFISVVPDVDIIFDIFIHQKKVDSKHRNYLTHWPIPMLIIGFITGYFFNGIFPWHIAIPLILLMHFIHDTVGCSGSLLWLAPFSFKPFWIVWRKGRIKILREASPNVLLDEFLENYTKPTIEMITSWTIFGTGFALAIFRLLQ